MNVLLVDDEIQIRKGLKMKVDWRKQGFEIIAEASNGEEALEQLKCVQIDLIITDMRMPIMDGVELARICHETYPEIKVVVLSGYSDFEYVKTSMKAGVRDYLLKPVAPDELVEVLQMMAKEIQEEKKKLSEYESINRRAHSHLQEVQDQYLLYLVKDEWLQANLVKERLRHLHLEEITTSPFHFLTVELRDVPDREERANELWYPFQLVCKELAYELNGVYSFINPSYRNVVHFLVLMVEQDNINLELVIQRIQKSVNQLLKLETAVGIGHLGEGLEQLKSSYISSVLAWSQSQFEAPSQVIHAAKIEKEIVDVSADFEKKLINSIEALNVESFQKNLDYLFIKSSKHSMWSFSFIANRTLFLLGSTAKKYDIESQEIKNLLWNCQQRIWELNVRQKVVDCLMTLAEEIIDKIRSARYSNGRVIVESVRQYMDEHYGSEISLSSLSEMFHINSAYLSELFKNQVGENFSDYLTNVRMEKAQTFLKERQLKIIDVANLVGFSNSGYFSTVFKKHFQQTPIEYRQANE
ncbi:hypothetical protein AJ85_02350 [Alkalihalobacillus alcalophilus ATCC 27647 = CGMCC 1.3604]|uniref:AraC family transcriptional regulator n=2 Tax=Alkalihalobacillus alcalophilus TaxID=1445 RepID=A0A4S4JTT8_ALKAL|nr:response regulator [Alkalihalobacillus alcalophilus]MED1562477.1 response regulator [Alkalihalobacillus alcalophilus]THG88566.1 hypothetical protein AJ85_02350 [Alkalihalobacillus alcalophilus ATCC 27647 = CGMCC 1.3604]